MSEIAITLRVDLIQNAQNGGKINYDALQKAWVHTDKSAIVAYFTETSGAHILAFDAGEPKRDDISTVTSEAAGGASVDKITGALVIVEKANPASPSSGYVAIGITGAGGAPDSPREIEEGWEGFNLKTPHNSDDLSVSVNFTTGSAVNKRVHIFLIGQPA